MLRAQRQEFFARSCMWGALPPMWGETPHTPLLLPTHPPFLRNPLATSARKTHPLRLRKDYPLAAGVPKDASPARGRQVEGLLLQSRPFLCKTALPLRVASALHVGGGERVGGWKRPAPHIHIVH